MAVLLITSNRLGDAVLTTGTVPYLAGRYPGEPIIVACGPLPAPLFAAMPEVAEVWPIPKARYGGHWWGLWRKAVTRPWRHVVDLRGSAFAYTVLARRRTVAGPERRLIHKVLQLTETLGAAQPVAPRLTWTEAQGAEARQRLAPLNGPLLAVGPAANWLGKSWPPDRFAETIARLVAANGPFADGSVLLAGAPGEEPVLDAIRTALPDCRMLPAVGWNLPVLAAALAAARLYIGNDSGLMHMAAAVGTPTLGLFGPSRDEWYAPWGAGNHVVRTATPFADFAARPGFGAPDSPSLMDEITVDEVVAAAMEMLADTPA